MATRTVLLLAEMEIEDEGFLTECAREQLTAGSIQDLRFDRGYNSQSQARQATTRKGRSGGPFFLLRYGSGVRTAKGNRHGTT